ncbi:MAG: hypothetical protein ABIS47_02810 [Acidimicrobiales bacterium]
MRRFEIGLVASVLALGIGAGAAEAHAGHPGPEGFGGQSPNIVDDYGDHYFNANNTDVRWDWGCHQFAVPGQGDEHANQDNAAIIDRDNTDSGLVAPGDKSVDCT